MIVKKFSAVILFLTCLSIYTCNAFQRPVNEDGETVVKVSIIIVDLEGINSADQNFEANVFYKFTWNDPTLVHSGSEPIKKPLNEIWRPSLIIVNQQRIWKTFSEIAVIAPNGDVTHIQRVWGSFSQPLMLRNFPFDSHKFNIQFASPNYSPSELKLVQNSDALSGISPDLSVPDWDILKCYLTTAPYQPIPSVKDNEAAAIKITFEARRHSKYFILNIILPLILIIFMSWIVFWIDPKDSGTQIAVSVTSMLTLIAFRFSIRESLPTISYLTLLDNLVLGATLLVFASLVEVIITSNLAKTGNYSGAVRVDKHARWIFALAFVLLVIFTIVLK